ncbi:MAG: TetR/AcrR family transcriptional regulator, partial [Ilumatobacteraceae bacterium]
HTPEIPAPIRKTRGRPRQSPHPTAEALLRTTVELLEVVAIDDVTISMVTERSGVSTGSLYHHYTDISDLVEQAVILRYTRALRESIMGVRELLDASDARDFRRRTERLLELTITSERRAERLVRVEVLGALSGRERRAERVARAQQEITDELAALLTTFQQRGWIPEGLHAVALAEFIQGMILGRVVDDVTENPVSQDHWFDVAIRAFRAVLFPSS